MLMFTLKMRCLDVIVTWRTLGQSYYTQSEILSWGLTMWVISVKSLLRRKLEKFRLFLFIYHTLMGISFAVHVNLINWYLCDSYCIAPARLSSLSDYVSHSSRCHGHMLLYCASTLVKHFLSHCSPGIARCNKESRNILEGYNITAWF